MVQPSFGYKYTNAICGQHEKYVLPSNTAQYVTIDASLIRLTDRIPQRGMFADLKAKDLTEFGAYFQFLYELKTNLGYV